jgi:hypothetical protein
MDEGGGESVGDDAAWVSIGEVVGVEAVREVVDGHGNGRGQ